MMMQIQRSNTILYCQQWAACVDFYRDIFQFPVSYQNDWFVELEIHPHAYLSLADETRATIRHANGQGITLAWQVAALDQIYARLQEKQVPVTAIQQKWGARRFYLYDPDGQRIE